MSEPRVLHTVTPVWHSLPISRIAGRPVHLKMEALQPVGSFKIRGIGHLCQNAVAGGARHFVSSSGGNAGVAAAYAGRELGVRTTVFVFHGVPDTARQRMEEYGAEVVVASAGLASRPALADVVRRAVDEADVWLTEIKAAAIDVVAEAAANAGKELVFCDNEPVAGDGDLGALVDELERLAVARFAARSGAAGRADGGSGGEV